MPRLLFGPGARGESVRLLQQKLTAAGFDTNGIDGGYGHGTSTAITQFQQRFGITPTGTVDVTTWTAITGAPIPSLRDRCLALTSTFEGHGFTLAQGNFDGAGVTWGIIGFTLKGGELASILRAAHASDGTLLESCFGSGCETLLQVCGEPWTAQLAWSDSVSSGTSKTLLAEPFKSGFAKLGQSPLGQQLQQQHVDDDYYKPALATAQKYGLKTELGIALCFDLHVQNGGISSAAGAAVRAQMKTGMAEQDVRVAIANAVADRALPAWRVDVRKRKLTVATGTGVVHDTNYVLKNWALDEIAAT
jgi:hypothetical protein